MSASACDSGCLDLRLVRFRIQLDLWLLSALSFFPLLPCGTLGFSSLEPNFFHHLGHDLFGGFRMLFEKLLRRFAAWPIRLPPNQFQAPVFSTVPIFLSRSIGS